MPRYPFIHLVMLLLATGGVSAARQPASPGSAGVIVPPADKVPPGQPIVFTATEDIAPPYRVTATISGDTIKIFVNGVLVRWMCTYSQGEKTRTILDVNLRSIRQAIQRGMVQVFLPNGGMVFSHAYARNVRQELHAARRNDLEHEYNFLRRHDVQAIASLGAEGRAEQ